MNEQTPNEDEFDDESIILDDDIELEDFDFLDSSLRNPVGVERLIWDELKQKYIYPEEKKFEWLEISEDDFN